MMTMWSFCKDSSHRLTKKHKYGIIESIEVKEVGK